MKQLILLIAIALMIPLGACHGKSVKKGGPYYYASFKTKSLPEEPLHELTQQEATGKPTYYVAHYTSTGNMERFSKYSQGKVEWESVYQYSVDGRLHAGSTSSQENGRRVRIEYVFDPSGKLASRTVKVEER